MLSLSKYTNQAPDTEQLKPFLGFFPHLQVPHHVILAEFGRVKGISRTLLSPFSVRRLSMSSHGSTSSSPEVKDQDDDDEVYSGGFHQQDEMLMSEAFFKIEMAAKSMSANAVIGLRLTRTESGSFIITGTAVYARPRFAPPTSPTGSLCSTSSNSSGYFTPSRSSSF